MSSVDDWLDDEKFDFDVTASPVGEKSDILGVGDTEQVEDEDDEEVFFGPQTHKERCAAVVVKEQEQKKMPIEPLDKEQQSQILKESTLLSIRIKHGTANKTKGSPVAVVHPMLREISNIEKPQQNSDIKSLENKENIATKLDKPTSMKIKASNILQSKFSNKNRPSSQPDPPTTKLPVSKTRSKIQSELTEPIVDKESLYGLNKTQLKPVKRRSGILQPMQAMPDVRGKTQASGMRPSVVPSALSRLKVPSTSTSNINKNANNQTKPMKVTGQSVSMSSLPQQGLRLQLRKNPSSAGETPLKSGIPFKRQSFTGTPSRKSTTGVPALSAKISSSTAVEVNGKKNPLVTPIQRTPSSRRSLTARQLVSKRTESSRTPSPDLQTKNKLNVPKNAQNSPQLQKKQQQQHLEKQFDRSDDNTMVPSSAHKAIMNRYKNLKQRPQQKNRQTPIFNSNKATDQVDVHSEVLPQVADNQESEKSVTNESSKKNQDDKSNTVSNLVEIITASPLMNLSTEKSKELMLDPFKTGVTPPPLIDVFDVLEPERPSQMNEQSTSNNRSNNLSNFNVVKCVQDS